MIGHTDGWTERTWGSKALVSSTLSARARLE
jgi:hypothetical protein